MLFSIEKLKEQSESMRTRQSLTEQAAVLFAGNVLAMLVGIAVPIVLVRIFPQEEYGLYQQLFLIFTTVFPFGQMGVTQGLYYFLPREPEMKDAIVTQTYLFVVVTGLLCMLSLLFFRDAIAGLMNNPRLSVFIPYFAVFMFLMIVSSFLETLMIAESRILLASSVRVISQIIRSCTIVITALVTKDILSIFKVLIFFALVRCVFQWIYLKGRYSMSIKKTDISFWKRQLGYSLPIGIANVAWLLQTKVHSFMVSFLFPPARFAVYAVGTYNLPLVGMITSSVSNVMVPELSRCHKERNIARILSVWSGAMRKMNLFLFPIFVFFFIMAHEFILAFFSAKYSESVPIFQVCLVAILVGGINTGAVLNAYAQTQYLMKLALFRIPVAIVILYVFAKTWGIIGAIVADVLVTVSFRLIVLAKVSEVMKISVMNLLIPKVNGKILGCAVLAACPVLILKFLYSFTPLVMLIVTACVFTLTYCSTGLLIGILTKTEIDMMRNCIVSKFG